YDCIEMVRKVTKYVNRILNPENVLSELETAYHYALTGRPGPVWLDFPMNIQAAPVDPSSLTPYVEPKVDAASPPIMNSEQGAAKAFSLLQSAKRPVIWLGHGIRLANAVELIEPLLNQLECPALISWAGIDMIDSDHPLVFGRAGVYGQRAANFILQNCDFLLTIGTRLAIPQIGYDLTELARSATIAVVDIDPLEVIKHGERIAYPVLADAKDFLSYMLKIINN